MRNRHRDCCEESIDCRLGPPKTPFTSSDPSGGLIDFLINRDYAATLATAVKNGFGDISSRL
jgi:hypothetical protein